MKAYICLTVANESNGNLTMVKVNKCSVNKNDLVEFLKAGPKSWKENIRTERGDGEFICEKNIHEVEIEGLENGQQ